MKYRPSVLLLTGDQLRHRYVAETLADSVRLVGVVAEAKAATVEDAWAGESAENLRLLEDHFRERDRIERELLDHRRSFPDVPLRRAATGTINSPDLCEWALELNPDFVVLYGTGLIRPPLLNLCPERTINLHLGLSPYYRGAGTNFWPFVYGEPECVGATIHLAVAKVDAGAILGQVRPSWRPSDGIHDAGTKTLMAAAAVLSEILTSLPGGETQGAAQDLSRGRVFRQKDFNSGAVRTARRRLQEGMIRGYVARAAERNDRFPIHEWTTVEGVAAGQL